jgi:hypothetical protein
MVVEGKELTMYQLLDKSHSILYDKVKLQKGALERLNECLQHEIKNPIHSIVAQNIEKSAFYKSLTDTTQLFHAMLEDMDAETLASVSKEFCGRQLELVGALIRGLEVQDASAEILSFKLQHYLDYA